MKKILALIFAASILMISGCTKEDKNKCPTPGVDVSPQQGAAQLYFTGDISYGFFEVEYGPNGFGRGNGTTETVANGYTIDNLNNGTYDIYVRGNCGGNDFSEWSEVRSFIVSGGGSSTCFAPFNLSADWYMYHTYWLKWYNNANAGYYQVEYGPTGFTKGSGTVANASDTYFEVDLTQGQTYDFYVRANCGGSDFSSWAGPSSFYADH